MHIQHITFYVSNIEKSLDFYQTMTGLTVDRRFQAGPGEVVFLSNGDGETQVELVYMPGGKTFEGKGMFVCFATDQLEVMHQLAVEKGMKPSPIQNPDPETRYFYVYDPDGVSVQLRYYPKNST